MTGFNSINNKVLHTRLTHVRPRNLRLMILCILCSLYFLRNTKLCVRAQHACAPKSNPLRRNAPPALLLKILPLT